MDPNQWEEEVVDNKVKSLDVCKFDPHLAK